MAIPAELKFDTRVRERLVGDGLLSEAEVQKHLESLPDLESQAVDLTIKQPALSNESDRDIVIVRTSGVRPPVAPIRRADDDLPIPDDDDDDDLDDLDGAVKAKKPAEKVVEKVKAKEVVADEEEDEDEDDEDEDEDEDDEDEDGEEKPAEEGEEP